MPLYGPASAGSALTVKEVDGAPSDAATTTIEFPNGTLGIAAHVATYTPSAAGTTIITKDEGSTLSSSVTTLDFVGAGVVASGAGATTTVTIAGGGVEPWHYEISPQVGSHGNTNWNSNVQNGSYFGSYDNESTGAQNAEIYWDIGLSGGTWDFELTSSTANNRGIYTVSIDAVSVGTIDGYTAGSVLFARSVLTGITIASGTRRLKLKMATKNASSSNYFGTIQHIQLRRTA